MLLTMGIIIGLVSTFTEIKLVHGLPAIKRLYLHGAFGIDGIVFNTAGSFVLSFIIGTLFGADGLVVMFGGVVGAALSQFYFSVEGFTQKRGWSAAGAKKSLHHNMDQIRKAKDTTVRVANDFKQPVQDLGRLVLILLRIITLPFIALRALSVQYSKNRT